MKKDKYNYADAEVDYRAGAMSVNAIATKHGIPEPTLRREAKKRGWVKPTAQLKTDMVKLVEIDVLQSAGFVYVIYIDTSDGRFYKIGLSRKFDSRMASHQCSSPYEVCVAIAYFVGNMRAEESALHTIFASSRVRGEWFTLTQYDLAEISKRTLLVNHE